jgi:isocitrate/isopropylmalate dehydrogenase
VIEEALKLTYADGISTPDAGGKHSTSAFSDEVLQRLERIKRK